MMWRAPSRRGQDVAPAPGLFLLWWAMLILTRGPGESILIGRTIRVCVLDARGKVRLGITAPATETVDRAEVRQRLNGERRKDGRKL